MKPAPTQPSDPLDQAEAAFKQGRLDHAVQLLGLCLRMDADDRRVYDLTASVLETRGGQGRQGLLFRMCADRFDDARPFYELGFEFMAADLPHMARPILERAARMDPDNVDIQVECAVAQAENGRHDEALATLERLPDAIRRGQSRIAFLQAWCRLLTGDLRSAESAIERFDTDPEAPRLEPGLAARLRLAVARLRAWGVPGEHDLRAWHFIQYGGAILSTGEAPGMGGRFGVLSENHEDLAARLADLEGLLRDLEFPLSRVVTPDQADSEVLGRVIAKRFRVPRTVFEPGAAVQPGTLLCVSGVDDLADATGLTARDPNLLVYAHRLSWTQSAPFTPDITGLVAEAHFLPWHRTFRLDATEKKIVEHPPDTRPPAQIAQHVFRLVPDPPAADDAPWRRTYTRHRALALYGADQSIGPRPAFRQESPVPGRRFL